MLRTPVRVAISVHLGLIGFVAKAHRPSEIEIAQDSASIGQQRFRGATHASTEQTHGKGDVRSGLDGAVEQRTDQALVFSQEVTAGRIRVISSEQSLGNVHGKHLVAGSSVPLSRGFGVVRAELGDEPANVRGLMEGNGTFLSEELDGKEVGDLAFILDFPPVLEGFGKLLVEAVAVQLAVGARQVIDVAADEQDLLGAVGRRLGRKTGLFS